MSNTNTNQTNRIENFFLAALLAIGSLGAVLAFSQGASHDEADFQRLAPTESVANYQASDDAGAGGSTATLRSYRLN